MEKIRLEVEMMVDVNNLLDENDNPINMSVMNILDEIEVLEEDVLDGFIIGRGMDKEGYTIKSMNITNRKLIDSPIDEYKQFIEEKNIDPYETHEWYRLIDESVERFNLDAIIVENDMYEIVLTEDAKRELETIIELVEGEVTTLFYIFEGNVTIEDNPYKALFNSGYSR